MGKFLEKILKNIRFSLKNLLQNQIKGAIIQVI